MRAAHELAKIAEAGNAKRAAAAKGNANAAKSKTVVDHSEQLPKERKVAVAREARAAEAKVSPATMGRAEQGTPDFPKAPPAAPEPEPRFRRVCGGSGATGARGGAAGGVGSAAKVKTPGKPQRPSARIRDEFRETRGNIRSPTTILPVRRS